MKQLSTLLVFLPQFLIAQSFTSYFTGDTTDVKPIPQGGVCLMGGATEDDNAMRWFLQRASGGDVVVIRASGSDGYNDYLYSDLGVAVNSVETILMPNAASALDPYVVQQIRNAEALWMAGGDQAKYISFWKDKPVEDALRYLVEEKNAVIGGTSAGMAVLGEAYFRAANGTVTSAEALANPFNNRVDLGYADFLDCHFLQNTITDTHYDDPDRRGRHFTFLARLTQSTGERFRGIACEEYTAVCIDTVGIARVFGGNSSQDFAYFLQTNCSAPFIPESCVANTPLHWVRDSQAVKVCKIKGTANGSNTFDLRDWHTDVGGEWQNWWSENGVFKTAPAADFQGCSSAIFETDWQREIAVFPNPANGFLQVNLPGHLGGISIQMIDLQGVVWYSDIDSLTSSETINIGIDIQNLPKGLYCLRISGSQGVAVRKIVVQ
jgi:cyanophycinase-like exopeptidase